MMDNITSMAVSNTADLEVGEKKSLYAPLKPGELRLLTVQPAQTTGKDGLIQCTLEHHSLEDLNLNRDPKSDSKYPWGDYIALSYC